MKAFSFIRSSLAGGCYQGPPAQPEESPSGVIPKVPSLLFDLEVRLASKPAYLTRCNYANHNNLMFELVAA